MQVPYQGLQQPACALQAAGNLLHLHHVNHFIIRYVIPVQGSLVMFNVWCTQQLTADLSRLQLGTGDLPAPSCPCIMRKYA